MPKYDWIQSRVILLSRSLGAINIAILATIFSLVCANPLQAQQRVRTAQGRLEIESFKNPEAFFRIGPLQEELLGSTGLEYTDNSGLTNTDKISRLRVSQGLDLNSIWFLSHLSSLRFDFAGQLYEDFYQHGRTILDFAIPNALLQFEFPISDFQVRLYERFSYVQNPTTNPSATNTSNANSLTNVIGAEVSTDWHLIVF